MYHVVPVQKLVSGTFKVHLCHMNRESLRISAVFFLRPVFVEKSCSEYCADSAPQVFSYLSHLKLSSINVRLMNTYIMKSYLK